MEPDHRKIRIIENATRVDHARLTSTAPLTRAWLTVRRQFLPYYFVNPPYWRVLLRAKMPWRRMTPEFLSLGAVRSGTTLMANYIMQHPCVVMPLAKEAGGRRPTRKLVDAHFPTLAQKRRTERRYGRAVTGFCSPVVPMTQFPYLAARVTPPESAKIILLIRNPIERTFAHWRWDETLHARLRKDDLWRGFSDFEDVVRIELDAMRSGGSGMSTSSGVGAGGYIQHSVYVPFVRALLGVFDRANILVVKSEDFFDDSESIAKQVYSFLELPPYEPVLLKVRNASPWDLMGARPRALLADFFRPLNEELYALIGRDLGWD